MFEQRQLTGAIICNTVDFNLQSSVKFYRTFLAVQKERSAAKHRLSCCFRLSAFLSLKGLKQKQTAQCDNVRIHSHVIIQLQQCGQQCGHGPHATVSVCHQASAGDIHSDCLSTAWRTLPIFSLLLSFSTNTMARKKSKEWTDSRNLPRGGAQKKLCRLAAPWKA